MRHFGSGVKTLLKHLQYYALLALCMQVGLLLPLQPPPPPPLPPLLLVVELDSAPTPSGSG
jgi:hypothetical protein